MNNETPTPANNDRRHLRHLVFGTAGLLAFVGLVVFLLLGLLDNSGFYAQLPWLHGYVQSWQNSSHADVPCRDCHFPVGFGGVGRAREVGLSLLVQGMTGTGSTNSFHFTGSHSCTRSGCHADILKDRGDVEWRSIHFSHRDHLSKIKRGLQPACSTCHQSLVHGTGQPVQTEACTICHFKGLSWEEDISRCRLCHEPDKLPTGRYDHSSALARGMACLGCHADVNQGTGEVSADRCLACHTLGSRADQFDNPKLVHSVHVGKEGFACTFCHEPIEHRVRPLAVNASQDCSICHRQPHVDTRELYLGVAAAQPEEKARPAAMAEVHVHCKGCHTTWRDTAGGGQVLNASGEGCVACHGKGYDRVLKEWHDLLGRDLHAARRAVSSAVDATRRRSSDDDARKAADAAKAKLDQVSEGHGVHNIVFAVEQLDHAVELANKALKAAGTGRSYPRISDADRLTANECARCHLDLPRTVRYDKRTFPHAAHVEAVGDCTSCHTPYSDHGKLSWGKEACGTCHGDLPMPHPADFRQKMGAAVKKVGFGACLQCHDTEAARTSCTPCHEKPGPAKWEGITVPHAPHLEAGVECTTCHTPLSNHGKLAIDGAGCGDCHGVVMPHPADWVDNHPAVAKKVGLDTCETCHKGGLKNELCQQCHG